MARPRPRRKKKGRRFGGFSGRADLVPVGHGSWVNDGCFSPVRKGWKPDIRTLGNANACPNPWGRHGPERPPNITGDAAGYNRALWRHQQDVANALGELGYGGTDGDRVVRRFQNDWNHVVSGLAHAPGRYSNVNFAHVPHGLCIVDGRVGNQTLNALEVALVNQRRSRDLAWSKICGMVKHGRSGYGRKHLYNAAQGGWLGQYE